MKIRLEQSRSCKGHLITSQLACDFSLFHFQLGFHGFWHFYHDKITVMTCTSRQVRRHLCGCMVSVWHSCASVLRTIRNDFVPQGTASKSPLCLQLSSQETAEHIPAFASCPLLSSSVLFLAQHTAFLSSCNNMVLCFNLFHAQQAW